MNYNEIWERYEKALESKPAKGPWTTEGIRALTDSVSDIPVLVPDVSCCGRCPENDCTCEGNPRCPEYVRTHPVSKKEFEEFTDHCVSDGYHTFEELYHYRTLYNALAVQALPPEKVTKSWRHSDGELCFGGGWFIVVMDLPTGQVSNHYEAKYWDMFQCQEVEFSPEWDEHTPEEAAQRLEDYLW